MIANFFYDPEICPRSRLDQLQDGNEEVSSSNDASILSEEKYDTDVEKKFHAEIDYSEEERRCNVEENHRGKKCYFRIKW